jgi:membrane protease YdiL (CAAX protease family)
MSDPLAGWEVPAAPPSEARDSEPRIAVAVDPPPPPRPPVSVWLRLLLYVVALVVAFLAVNFAVGLPVLLLTFYGPLPPLEKLERAPELHAIVELLVAGVTAALSAAFWVFLDRRPFREFGLRLPVWADWRLALPLAIIPFAVSYPFIVGSGHLRILGPVGGSVGFAAYRIALLAVLSLLVGIAEEVSFRGYLLPNLSQAVGRTAGILVSTALFTVVHLASADYWIPLNFADVFVAGLALAWLRLGTGGLTVPILVHAVYDFVLFVWEGDPRMEGAFLIRRRAADLWLGGEHVTGLIEFLAAIAWAAWIWRFVYVPSLSRVEPPSETPDP